MANNINNIVDFILQDAEAAKYESLTAAATFTGLVDTLRGEGLMAFAPGNSVFDGAPAQYRWNKALTKDLLLNHVTDLTDLAPGGETLKTKLGGDNTITATDTKIGTDIVITAESSKTDTYAVYDINGFLIPSSQNSYSKDTLFTGAASRLGETLKKKVSADLQKTLGDLGKVENDPKFSEDYGYTVFLPTKDAFTELLDEVGTLNGVAEYLDEGGLNDALRAHTVVGGAPVKEIEYISANTNKESKIKVSGSKVNIDGEETDLDTEPKFFTNGQVHDIQKVLYFPRKNIVEIAEQATKKLYGLIGSIDGLAGSLLALKKSTVFAPTDAALERVECLNNWIPIGPENIEKVLKHHVVGTARVYSKNVAAEGLVASSLQGEDIKREDLALSSTDVIATNGNIHVVDKVIIPPTLRDALPKGTIVDIAKTATSTLYDYVALAGLADTLNTCPESGKAYTVFAPTNKAFEALTPADLDYLTAENNKNLKKVLLHHVVSAPAFKKDLEPEQSFKTVNGDNVVVKNTDEGVFVGGAGAQVTAADNQAFNGIIHIIDEILIPEGIELPSSKPSGTGAASMTSVSAISTALLGAASYFLAL